MIRKIIAIFFFQYLIIVDGHSQNIDSTTLLLQKIVDKILMKDVCMGTGIDDSLPFYYNQPVAVNDKNGTVILLEAGIEIIQLKQLIKNK